MFTYLRNLLGQKRGSSKPAAASRSRSVSLRLEALEDRLTPSTVAATPDVMPINNPGAPTQIQRIIYQPAVVDVPNLQGLTFHLVSSTMGKPAHDLHIQSETYNANGSASFTGTWTGDNSSGKGTPKPVTGSLSFDSSGNMILSFSWMNGSGGQNSFSGVLTRANTAYTGYYLEGNVMASSPSDGPGHVSGYSEPLVTAHF
jgi:hypothetical protein